MGAHVLFELVNSGLSVKALQRETSSTKVVLDLFKFYSPHGQALFNSIKWVTGDIIDITSLDNCIAHCTAVFHCAALVSFSASDYQKLLKVNSEGTANVVNQAISHGIKEFYYVSSVAAIGRNTKTKRVKETTEWEASVENSGYAVSKHNAEMEVWRGGEEGLNIAIVNPTIVLGPGRTDHSSGTLFKAVAKRQRYYTEGENGFVDARDVAFVLKRLYDQKVFGQRYILTGENLSYRAVANSMAVHLKKLKPSIKAGKWATGLAWRLLWIVSKFTGKKPVLTRESARSSHRITIYENHKIREELGITFHSVDQAVENATAFFRAYPSHL